MAQGSSLLRVPPSHPAPHPTQPSQTPAELHPPQWGLGGLTGASVPWAPAHRRQRLFLAQRKSNVLRFSILSSKAEEVEQPLTPGCLCGAGLAARQGGCGAASAPKGDVVAPGSSPHSCLRGLLHVRLCQSLFPYDPISNTLPRENGLSGTGISFLLSLLQQDPSKAPEQDMGCSTPDLQALYPTMGTCVPSQSPCDVAQLACPQRGWPWQRGTGLRLGCCGGTTGSAQCW